MIIILNTYFIIFFSDSSWVDVSYVFFPHTYYTFWDWWFYSCFPLGHWIPQSRTRFYIGTSGLLLYGTFRDRDIGSDPTFGGHPIGTVTLERVKKISKEGSRGNKYTVYEISGTPNHTLLPSPQIPATVLVNSSVQDLTCFRLIAPPLMYTLLCPCFCSRSSLMLMTTCSALIHEKHRNVGAINSLWGNLQVMKTGDNG